MMQFFKVLSAKLCLHRHTHNCFHFCSTALQAPEEQTQQPQLFTPQHQLHSFFPPQLTVAKSDEKQIIGMTVLIWRYIMWDSEMTQNCRNNHLFLAWFIRVIFHWHFTLIARSVGCQGFYCHSPSQFLHIRG